MKIPSLKRSFDIAAAATGLVATAPLIAVTAAAMGIANKSNPFLVQKRVGQHGQLFPIYKIKTMKDVFNEQGEPLPEELRTTTLGKIVRKIKLDELPQLFNVLKGDMSLIGPRPLLPRNDIAHDTRRQEAIPGLMGLAQLKGPNALSRRNMLRYDLLYIERRKHHTAMRNFIDDLAIIGKTIPALIKHRKDPFFKKPGSL